MHSRADASTSYRPDRHDRMQESITIETLHTFMSNCTADNHKKKSKRRKHALGRWSYPCACLRTHAEVAMPNCRVCKGAPADAHMHTSTYWLPTLYIRAKSARATMNNLYTMYSELFYKS